MLVTASGLKGLTIHRNSFIKFKQRNFVYELQSPVLTGLCLYDR